MKYNNSVFSTRMFLLLSFLLFGCEPRNKESLLDFSGFWVSENGTKFIYITDGFAVDDFKLGCIFPLIMENGALFLLDSCVNVVEFNCSNEKLRLDLNQNNQLLLYYDYINDFPDFPDVFNRLESKVCELQIVEIRLKFVGLVGPYLHYANQINVDLVKDEVWINGELKENSKSINWLKTYCYDEISTKRTDIDFPPAPTGVMPIYIELIFPDGRKELTTLEGLLGAPLEVQALVFFLVSLLAP